MNKYKVTATRNVGYTATIEAENEEEALAIARGVAPYEPYYDIVDVGVLTIQSITSENIWRRTTNERYG
jgi:hypothetical protein